MFTRTSYSYIFKIKLILYFLFDDLYFSLIIPTTSGVFTPGSYSNVYLPGVCGLLTDSSRKLILNVPLAVSRNVQENISVSSLTGAIVASAGGYFGGNNTFNFLPYLQESKVVHGQSNLFLVCYSAGGWGSTNNTPCSGWLTMSFTLYS